MFRHRQISYLPLVVLALLGLMVGAQPAVAAPLQDIGTGSIFAWWHWLVIISAFLLVAFIIFIALAWRDSSSSIDDENDR